jgi:hypothetical protein
MKTHGRWIDGENRAWDGARGHDQSGDGIAMFCSNCGEKATGRFCAFCGSPVTTAAPGAGSTDGLDWKDEARYHVLLHFPEVRDLIARNAPPSLKGLSGQDILNICDTLSRPLTGLPISISKLSSVVVPIYARLGIQTGATRKEVVLSPIGKTLVAALCSLSRRGRTLKEVHQGADGCVIEATLPGGWRSYEGQIVLSIERQQKGTLVDAAVKIPGQKYDWGISRNCIEETFEDLRVLVN